MHASEQDRPDVARRRAQWRRYQSRVDPERLVRLASEWRLPDGVPVFLLEVGSLVEDFV